MIEDVVARIETELANNLSSELTAFETYQGVTLNLPLPKEIRFSEVRELQSIPAILILPSSSSFSELISGKKDATHTIDVVIVCADTNDENLSRKLWRYGRSIERVLEKYVEGSSEVFRVEVVSWLFSPTRIRGGGYEADLVIRADYKERLDRPI